MSSLSVVIPATDHPSTLATCVAALEASTTPPDEIVVVDRPRRASPARARTEGVARSRGDVIVFVDADVVVHPDALARIRARFDGDPELAALFGSYDDRPADRHVVSTYRNLVHHRTHQRNAGPAETFWTGLGAVRRCWFDAVGGFDSTRYPTASIEDIDLGLRLRDRGASIELDPDVLGTHLKRWTVRSMVGTDLARRGVPWVAAQVRRRRLATTLNLDARGRASALAGVTVAVALASRRPAVAVAAVAALAGIELELLRLVARRRGPLAGAAALGLHVVHHVSAAASVPVGVAVGLLDRRSPPEPVRP